MRNHIEKVPTNATSDFEYECIFLAEKEVRHGCAVSAYNHFGVMKVADLFFKGNIFEEKAADAEASVVGIMKEAFDVIDLFDFASFFPGGDVFVLLFQYGVV